MRSALDAEARRATEIATLERRLEDARAAVDIVGHLAAIAEITDQVSSSPYGVPFTGPVATVAGIARSVNGPADRPPPPGGTADQAKTNLRRVEARLAELTAGK